MNSILAVVEVLKEHSNILITSGTIGSAYNFEKRFSSLPQVYHQFAPLDSIICVRRFLGHFKPETSCFVESEIWPNLLYEASLHSKVLSLNTSLSPKSLARWLKMPSVFAWVFGRFSAILPSSKALSVKLCEVGFKNVHFFGNLKYGANINVQLVPEVKELNGKFVIVFASLHLGEEALVAEAIKHLIFEKNLAIVILPRHINFATQMAESLLKNGISCKFRSKGEKFSEGKVYMADTLGEALSFFKTSKIVFIGGSLLPIGGHNIIEPAIFGNALIMGKFYFKMKEIADEFLKQNALITIEPEEVLKTITNLLENGVKLKEMGLNAKEICKNYEGIAGKVANFILSCEKSSTKSSSKSFLEFGKKSIKKSSKKC